MQHMHIIFDFVFQIRDYLELECNTIKVTKCEHLNNNQQQKRACLDNEYRSSAISV